MAEAIFKNATLSIAKATDTFNPDDTVQLGTSEFIKRMIRFSATAGDNRHNLAVEDILNKDENKRDFKCFSRNTRDDAGNTVKGENYDVKWSERTKPENIEKAANFKRYIFDTETYGVRRDIKAIIDGLSADGIPETELMEKYGVKTLDEAKELQKKSWAKQKVFITAYDYAEMLSKLFKANKIKDMKFDITCEINYEYNAEKNEWYQKFVPKSIYKARPDVKPESTGSMVFVFNPKNCVDDADFETTGEARISGYVKQYMYGCVEKNYFVPVTLVVNKKFNSEGKNEAAAMLKKMKKKTDKDWNEIELKLAIVNGSQYVEFSEDLMDDEMREDYECGLITFEDARKQFFASLKDGKGIKGEREQYIAAVGLAKSGVAPTEYTDEDIYKIPVKKAKVAKATEELDDDIFD